MQDNHNPLGLEFSLIPFPMTSGPTNVLFFFFFWPHLSLILKSFLNFYWLFDDCGTVFWNFDFPFAETIFSNCFMYSIENSVIFICKLQNSFLPEESARRKILKVLFLQDAWKNNVDCWQASKQILWSLLIQFYFSLFHDSKEKHCSSAPTL